MYKCCIECHPCRKGSSVANSSAVLGVAEETDQKTGFCTPVGQRALADAPTTSSLTSFTAYTFMAGQWRNVSCVERDMDSLWQVFF